MARPPRPSVLRSTMSPPAHGASAPTHAHGPGPGSLAGSSRAVLPERRTSGPQGIRGAPRGGRMRVSIAEVAGVEPAPTSAPVPAPAPASAAQHPPPQLPSISHLAWAERSDDSLPHHPGFYTARDPLSSTVVQPHVPSPGEDYASQDELELEGESAPSAPPSLRVPGVPADPRSSQAADAGVYAQEPVYARAHAHAYAHAHDPSVDAMISAATEGPVRSASLSGRLSYDSDESDEAVGESGTDAGRDASELQSITKAELHDMEARIKSHVESELGRAADSLVGRVTEALVQRIVQGLAGSAVHSASAVSPVTSISRPLASGGRKRKAPSSIPSEADGPAASRPKAEPSAAADAAPDPVRAQRISATVV